MDLEQAARALREGENGEALRRLTESEAGAALAGRFDGRRIERAVKNGDTEALSRLLSELLSTPEGARFAGEVRRAVDGGGR